MPNVIQVPGFGFITASLPDSPSSIAGTASAGDTITGTYVPASAKGATHYLGYRLGNGLNTETVIVVSGGTFTITGLTRNTSYLIRMYAKTFFGPSTAEDIDAAWTDPISVFTTDVFTKWAADSGPITTSAGSTPAVNDNDPVGKWTDLGYAVNTPTVADANRPTLKTNIVNSKPAIRFNGSNTFLRVTTGAFVQPLRVLMVFVPRATSGGTVLMDAGSVGTNRCKIDIFNGLVRINSGTQLTGPAVVVGTPYLLDALFNGTESTIRLNNGPVTIGDAGSNSATGITLGCNEAGASFSQYDLCEWEVTGIDHGNERSRLATKYNLFDPNSDSIIQDLLDATVEGGTCDLPEGIYPVGSYAQIKKNMTVNAHASGTTFLCNGSSSSAILTKPTGYVEHHGTGTITQGNTDITVADPASFSIGQKIWIEFGVAATDGHEPYDTQFFTIANKVGSVLTLDPPFPRTVPTYSSTPPYTWASYPERSGPWHQGSDSGQYWRGFGADHSVYTATNVITSVTVNGITTGLAEDHNPNTPAQASVHTMWASNVTYNNIHALVMQSSLSHAKRSVNVSVNGAIVDDSISTVIWNVNAYPSNLFSGAGTTNYSMSDVTANGGNLYLMNQEACSRGSSVSNISITTDYTTGPVPSFQNGNFGQCNATITDFTLAGTLGFAAFDADLSDTNYTVTNLRVESANFSELVIGRYSNIEHLCGHDYLPQTTFQETITIPAKSAGQTFNYDLPLGIFYSVEVRIANISGLSGVGYPAISISPFVAGQWMRITDLERTNGHSTDYRYPFTVRHLGFRGNSTPLATTADIRVVYQPEDV